MSLDSYITIRMIKKNIFFIMFSLVPLFFSLCSQTCWLLFYYISLYIYLFQITCKWSHIVYIFPSQCKMFLKFIHVVGFIMSSFLLLNTILLYGCTTNYVFICKWCIFGLFYCLATINKIALDVFTHACKWTYVFGSLW